MNSLTKPPVPGDFKFLVPWHRTDQPLHDELYRELSRKHQLYGIKAHAIARRQDNDDVLFELLENDATKAFAVVHLTWSSRPDQYPDKFPSTDMYSTLSDWVTRCMVPDAYDWES